MRFVPKIPKTTADLSRGIKDWPTFLKDAASISLSILFIYLALGWTADAVSLYIPDRYEARVFHWLKSGERNAEPELERAAAVFGRMIDAEGLRALPYGLSLSPVEDPNAFALPGGRVALTRGLLKEVEGDAGLALVIGHELGHHQHRDALRGMGRLFLLQTAMSVFFGESDGAPAQAILRAAESGHSRAQERRADEFGLRLSHAVFGHRDGELEFFEKAAKEGKDSRWASFLASHPYTPDRIEYLKKLDGELLAAGK